MENTETMMGSQTKKVETFQRDNSDQGDAILSSSPQSPAATKGTTSDNPDKEESTSTATEAGNRNATPNSESSGAVGSNDDAATTPLPSTDGATALASSDSAAVAPATTSLAPTLTVDEPKRLDTTGATLQFDTIADALSDGLMGREPVTIADDDVSTVKIPSNARSWVEKLVAAFGQDYLAAPVDAHNRSDAQKLWWTRWQGQGHASVAAIFDAESKGVVHLEKSCWHLFDAVVKAHELGFITSPSANNNTLPSKLKCSDRLTFIVSMLEKYALVRLDVMRAWHVDEIAANPEIFIKRKITNCWNNGNRAMKIAAARGEDAATAGKTRGRKRAAATAFDADASQLEEDANEAPVKAKRARKSAVTTVNDTAKTSRKGKGKTGTGAKRALSEAIVSDEPDSEKLVASSEAPSATEAQDDDGEDAGSGAEDDDGEGAGSDAEN
jgi:hypothetical protein